MASATNFPGDIIVPGNIRVSGNISPLKAKSDVLSLVEHTWTVPWTLWRVHDAMQTNLPGAAADDDLGLIGGTFGTGVPSLQTVDFGGTDTTAYARAQIPLQANYEAGQSVKLRFHCGSLTTLPDAACTLDVVCYKSGEESLVSAGDICFTTVQTITPLTMADVDFTITATTLAPGDMLDTRIVLYGEDAGNVGVMTLCIGAVQLLYYGR